MLFKKAVTLSQEEALALSCAEKLEEPRIDWSDHRNAEGPRLD